NKKSHSVSPPRPASPVAYLASLQCDFILLRHLWSGRGVVYFEEKDLTWGTFCPKVGDTLRVRLKLIDSFGKPHRSQYAIPVVSLPEARKFGPDIGKTFQSLNSSVAHPGSLE